MNNHNQSFHRCSCGNDGPSKSMRSNHPEYRNDNTRATELNSYINVMVRGYREVFPSEDVIFDLRGVVNNANFTFEKPNIVTVYPAGDYEFSYGVIISGITNA
ncbi:hypothetical protein ID853_19825, partial [Xenorhabdus sp. Vera]|uniref:hypothetical protein n=1 Tax=Xenorhabdus koppenhoeferi TaxID=351659 RepID=UPI0019B51BAC